MSDYETLRRRHADEYTALLPQFLERITWSKERLRDERQQRLRALIRLAKERSPWHRERLSSIDPDRVTEADLTHIPPMTKDDMMGNFDGILTDRRLSRELVETHLASLVDDAYLLDEFHVVSSGGSSGTRGVFVYGWDAWMVVMLTLGRFRMRHLRGDPQIGPSSVRANVAASKATHMTFAGPRTFPPPGNFTAVSATLPLNEIVDLLNELDPAILTGYPSSLYSLAREAIAGRLHIAPHMVGPNSEPLLPEMRDAMEEAWHCPILNGYGTSEGPSAMSCGQGRGMHLGEDVSIFELVDEAGDPVPPGVRAAKMYITNLLNVVQPLIRYELTDEVTLIDEPCPCRCQMRRIDDIEGRTDDVFAYASGIIVHPLLFRSRLGGNRNIDEYQVHQTSQGASVSVRAQSDIDTATLSRSIEQDLERAGLRDPTVTIEIVDSFDRQQTGKLKRFFPL
jgi:phenylacetate-CoA ligase